MTLPPLLQLLRLPQWAKNAVLAAPLLFVPQAWETSAAWTRLLLAIAGFCALSSATYVVNDLLDRHADRLHPDKQLRPLASGTVSLSAALTLALVLLVLGLGGLALVTQIVLPESYAPEFPDTRSQPLAWGLAYLALALSYSTVLKRYPIIDVLAVSLGFVLRALAGAAALAVAASPWLLLCTFLLMLLISLGKRRWELQHLADAQGHRTALEGYDLALLDQYLMLTASMTVLGYALYTFTHYGAEDGHPTMMGTTLFVLYGVLRYLWLLHRGDGGGTPEQTILRDKPVLVTMALWVLAVMASLRWG